MVIKRDFIYTPKGKNRPLHIYLPDDYELSQERYPVVYFFDGHNLFFDEDATYGKSWGVKTFLDGWGKKLIVVGIECGHDGQERLSEYLPYPADVGSRFDVFEPMGGATMDWIVEELKPVIDRDYRTIPFRECTGIAGSSMGGLMALYAAVHYNRWFSKAACVSTAMGFCMGPVKADMEANPVDPDTRIYLSWGTKEAFGLADPTRDDRSSKTYGWNKWVADRALSDGAAVKLDCQVGGGHCEADWEKLVPTFMNFLWTE
ncbi:MAG: alpha/beta hydrolase [Oscillospiraceae bacterium]|nr:alpha/beta hydrolase [Oscillospiraceae bacterium]